MARLNIFKNQRTGALPEIKKKVIDPLAVYAGKSERSVLGKHYIVYHHFFVDKRGVIIKYEDIYEEVL